MQNAKTAMEKAVDAAIAEADKGIFVSQEAVDRWMESWGTENELPMPDIFPEDDNLSRS